MVMHSRCFGVHFDLLLSQYGDQRGFIDYTYMKALYFLSNKCKWE